jgi:hypothetical protein
VVVAVAVVVTGQPHGGQIHQDKRGLSIRALRAHHRNPKWIELFSLCRLPSRA